MGSQDDEGLIPRICQELFLKMQVSKQSGSSFRTEVSYLEIYNEHVKDLLDSKSPKNLKVREHPKTGPYVQDLTKHLVTDYSDVQELMAKGNANRTTASTNMNDTSSRSHAIFTVTFSQASFDCEDTPRETLSKLNLVDLAGSERANATGASGVRLLEGAHINKSLVTLGSVIKALANTSSSQQQNGVRKSTQSSFIPYRDSVLTWLLKDSLGGNSKTIMISTISPADVNYGETLSTLRYSNRAKDIINSPTINEDTNTRLIRDLRSEIERLKSLIAENPNMIEKVHENEAKVKLLTEEWTQKWIDTHRILSEQRTLGLRKAGIGIILDSDRPHLIGIDDSLLSTGITLYHLNEGVTRIGTEYGNEKQDIILTGVEVEDEHCLIELTKDGEAYLIPLNDSVCYVNTIRVCQRTKISQGCILCLGRSNMFRFNDPQEANRLRMNSSGMSNTLGEMTNNQMNLSRVFSQSSDLTKSVDNLWNQMNNNFDYSDLDLEEKRKEIEELEEEHKRAEERRKEEQFRADEALRQKRAELSMLKDESETLHKLIEDSIKAKEQAEAELKKLNEQKEQFKQLAGDCTETGAAKLNSDLQTVNSTDLISIELDDAQDAANDGQLTQINLMDVDLNGEISDDELNPTKRSPAKTNELRTNSSDISDILISFAQRFKLNAEDGSPEHQASLIDLDDTTGSKPDNIVDQKTILNHFEELINKRFKELISFEDQLKDMEKQLNQQKQLFEIQRNKELGAIEKEKYNLEKMEEQVKMEALIEKEVQRRLKEQQSNWRKEMESRASSYLHLTAAPSPPPSPQAQRKQLNGTSPSALLMENGCSDRHICVQIPLYVLRSVNFDAHFEYECRISLNGGEERLIIFRRYRRFRELHFYLLHKYGSDGSIVLPAFPPKVIDSWSFELTNSMEV